MTVTSHFLQCSTEFNKNGNWRFGKGKESIFDAFIYLFSYEFVIHATALKIIKFVNNIQFVTRTKFEFPVSEMCMKSYITEPNFMEIA